SNDPNRIDISTLETTLIFYDSDGNQISNQKVVGHLNEKIIALADDRIIQVWGGQQGYYGTQGQVYSAAGVKIGPEVLFPKEAFILNVTGYPFHGAIGISSDSN